MSLSPSSSKSPFGALPSELLSEIFRLCALSVDQTHADMDGENACMTVNPFGLDCTIRLATVCRKWRNIIYKQANLWSNICITQTYLLSAGTGMESQLRTEQIETCLARSGKYPLNILIDARDPDWNWMEDGVGIHANDHELDDDSEIAMETDPSEELMPILFTPSHMSTAISLLLPHLSRWKSLTILTDTWAPMHRVLSVINPAITTSGAPLLETLSLLRCNVLPSYFHDFQPAHLKDPAFLSGGDLSVDILPRLKHLLLEGVHVDWDALGARLDSASSKTLESLELRYHCAEVRPTLAQYRKLLSSSSNLQKLSIKCSGTYILEDKFVLPANYVPMLLPKLEELTLGYQTAEDGEMALELFDAPNVRRLTLEDCSHYASAEQYADDMLAYLASKASYGLNTMDADAAEENATPTCTSERRADEPVTSPKRTYFSTDPLPPFPLLDTVILKRVDGSAEALHTFFLALDHVQRVEIAGMTLDALRALLPSVGPTGPSCACPELQEVVVHGIEKGSIKEFGYYSDALMRERPKYYCKLKVVELRQREGVNEGGQEMDEDEEDVDVESSGTDSDDDSEVASVGESAVAAGVFQHQRLNHDLKGQDQDVHASFKPDHDGIFNDSEAGFDVYYATSQLVCH